MGADGVTRVWCQSCGYDRSGLPEGGLCPECGATYQPAGGDAERLSPGASQAVVALGLGVLSWAGLLGMGVLGVVMGVMAFVVGLGAVQLLRAEQRWRTPARLAAIGGMTLGATAAVAGAGVVWVLARALL